MSEARIKILARGYCLSHGYYMWTLVVSFVLREFLCLRQTLSIWYGTPDHPALLPRLPLLRTLVVRFIPAIIERSGLYRVLPLGPHPNLLSSCVCCF